jgi:hypothetical protein
LGGLVATLTQFYFSMRSQDIERINDLIMDIERIEKLSIQYWLNSSAKNYDEQMDIAAQIRGATHATSAFLDKSKSLFAGDWEKYKELDGKLFDLTSGGLFESKKQVKDWQRVVEIMECINEIRHLMRGSRRKMFWAR